MATAIEYGLIAAGISVAIIATVNSFSSSLSYTVYDKPRIVSEPPTIKAKFASLLPGERKYVVVDWTTRYTTGATKNGTEYVTSCKEPKIEWVEKGYHYAASIDRRWSARGGYTVTC